MSHDENVLHAFAHKLMPNLYIVGSKSQQSLLVAIKYNGTMHPLHSGNRDIAKEIGNLNINSSPYYCWRRFVDVSEGNRFVRQLKTIDLSIHIPEDPAKLQRYW